MQQFEIKQWFKCLLLCLVGVMGLPAMGVLAQNYPSRPITVINPYPGGSFTDLLLRMMCERVTKTLGQPVVVDYRPGGAGRLGALAVMSARGQGYLVSYVSNTTMISDPILDPTFAFQPGKDYTPIVATWMGPFVLVANATLPIRDLPGLIAYAKANPGKLNFGAGSNVGSMSNIGMIMMNEKLGTDFTTVPYKTPMLMFAALLSGEVQASLTTTAIKPHVDSGKLVALAVTSAKPMSMYPNVPTVNEVGLPFLNNMGSWNGIVGAADLPREIPLRLNRAFDDMLKTTPEVSKRLSDNGFVLLGGSPEDFSSMIRREQEAVGPVLKRIKVE